MIPYLPPHNEGQHHTHPWQVFALFVPPRAGKGGVDGEFGEVRALRARTSPNSPVSPRLLEDRTVKKKDSHVGLGAVNRANAGGAPNQTETGCAGEGTGWESAAEKA